MSSSALDNDIPIPPGWRQAWLSRTYFPLQMYTNIASYALSLSILFLAVKGFVSVRRSAVAMRENPSSRAAVRKQMDRNVVRVTRAHFAVALAYMLNAVAIVSVDTVIALLMVRGDVAAHPELWNNSQLWSAIGLALVTLIAVLAASYVLVPLLQLYAAAWLLARFGRRNRHADCGGDSVLLLSDYVPEARYFATHIAQLWCMLLFFIIAWSSPEKTTAGIWHLIAMSSCNASALVWLDVSFALNFRADRLHGLPPDRSAGGLAGLLGVLCKNLGSVHCRPASSSSSSPARAAPEKDAGLLLPRYEDVPPPPPPPALSEKE